METYTIGNRRSYSRLSANGKREEHARDYYDLLKKILRDHPAPAFKGLPDGLTGVMTAEQLRKLVWEIFGAKFGPNDLRKIGRGKRRQPKWHNSVAWALVMGAAKEGIVSKEADWHTRRYGKTTYIVHPEAPAQWVEWATEKKRKPFIGLQRCKKCRRKFPLRRKACPQCKTKTPKKAARIRRIPR